MHVETPAELHARAAHARELADNMCNREAQTELREIADALDAEADVLARENSVPPPTQASAGRAPK
jgi:hypothetical protein